MARAGHRFATYREPMTARGTNLSVLVALLLLYATGVGAVATGSSSGRWIVIAHGIVAFAAILLIRWKAVVIRRGWRRRRIGRLVSLALAGLVVATLLAGLISATGLVVSIGGFLILWLHIAGALILIPPLLVHLFTRPVRVTRPRFTRPRFTRLRTRRSQPVSAAAGRRAALRAGAVVGLATLGYGLAEVGLRVTGAPGGHRRFTGSHPISSADPAAMPATSWIDDAIPYIDIDVWRLSVTDPAGRRELTLDDLSRDGARVRATLDCTSGWYAEHEWSGVPVSALVTPDRTTRSLYVHSVTGYWIRFPVADLGTLLLATRVSGQPLLPGHGYPLRLVAPGRRGYWWVKWVDRIQLDGTPPWWQPPFPVT
jgi:DMSO/TMAO reductase YedYZ molybdopterin-dependent catalytic subunit